MHVLLYLIFELNSLFTLLNYKCCEVLQVKSVRQNSVIESLLRYDRTAFVVCDQA
jgi:hypothetical protein